MFAVIVVSCWSYLKLMMVKMMMMKNPKKLKKSSVIGEGRCRNIAQQSACVKYS